MHDNAVRKSHWLLPLPLTEMHIQYSWTPVLFQAYLVVHLPHQYFFFFIRMFLDIPALFQAPTFVKSYITLNYDLGEGDNLNTVFLFQHYKCFDILTSASPGSL